MSGYTSQKALKEMGNVSFSDRTENPWSKFYGQPAYYSPDMLDPEARKLTSAPDLPVAYVGKNYFIPSLVEELVMTTDNWYTRIALPLRFTDQITWKMNITTFDQRLPRNTPHKATSRILDSRQTSRNGKLERHGVMYEMEANFMDTQEGREHYAFTLNQMANGIVMLLNIGVINAYLEADNYQKEWEKANGMRVASDIYLKIEREINMFAIVQKEKHGLKKLDAVVSEWMEAYQGTANMWILPPMLKMYNDLVPPENTEFYRAGPRAAINVDDATTVRFTLGGNMVYLSRMIDNVTEFGQRNLLARTVEIGSYNTMVDVHKNKSDKYFSEEYQSDHRSIKVYDEDEDEDVIKGMDFAIDNCHIFDERSGLVNLPKNNRIYSSNPSDRQNDMFSYNDDDNSSVRKPATLFGHISENHFSANSLINLCRSVAKHHGKTGQMSVGEMEEILNSGISLVDKINSAPVTLTWFFNVFMEHVNQHGVVGNENMADAQNYKDYIKKITKVAKRSSQTMRVLKGVATNGMNLPEFDYYAALKAAFVANARDQTITSVINTAYVPGGSSLGSLVGFGSWDGLLMLQTELGSGGSPNTGFTKNGYLITDCRVADRFIKLVKSLTVTLNFIFDNNIFLNKNKASSLVEEPTTEHVLAEWLLGLTGIPIFLDVTKLTSLRAPDGRGRLGQADGVINLQDAMTSSVSGMDNQNMATLGIIKQWVTKEIDPKDRTEAASLQKKLDFYFDPLLGTAFNPGNPLFGTTTSRENLESRVGQLLTTLGPLSNLNPQTLSHRSFVMRSMVLELLNKYIVANKKINTETKKNLLSDFFAFIGKATRLDSREALIPNTAAWVIFKNGIDGLALNASDNAVNAGWAGNIAGTPWFDRNDYAPLTFDIIADWFVGQQKAFKLGTLDGIMREKYTAYAKTEERDRLISEEKLNNVLVNRVPLLYMMNINSSDNPADAETLRGRGAENFPGGGDADELRINAQYDDDNEENQFFEAGAGPVVYGGERFFRSPLVLSAKQAVQAMELLKTDRALDAIMNIRLADPTNIDRYVDPSQIKALVKKIQAINKGAQENYLAPGMSDNISFASAYESPLLFYPENMKLKERALALTAFGRGKVGAFGGKPLNSKRSRFQSSTVNTNARRDDGRMTKQQKTSYGLRMLSSRDDRGGNLNDDDDDFNAIIGEDMDGSEDEYSQTGFDSSNLGLLRKQMGGSEDDENISSNVLNMFIKLSDATNSRLHIMIAKVYLTSLLNKRTLTKFYKHGIVIPFGALLFRPHMRYESNMGIKALAGESTGVTLVGHTGLALQNDVATKTHIGHFTLYDSSVVIRNKQVFVQPNVFISRCLGGAGFSPMDPRFYNTRTGETGGGCVICVLIPYEEVDFHNYIDVTGRFEQASTMQFVDGNKMNRPQYSQCWRTNQIWRIKGGDQVGADDIGHDDQSGTKIENTIVIKAQQYNYSTSTRSYTDKITNKGHWGPEGPGSKAGRNGGLKSLVEHPTVQLV